MTPQRAKELLPVITAFAEGKTVQMYNAFTNKWVDIVDVTLGRKPGNYRIKPEVVKYRRCLVKDLEGSPTIINVLKRVVAAPEQWARSYGKNRFIRWIDNDWIEEEV